MKVWFNKISTRSFWATLGGVLTGIVVKLAADFDFDTFDVHSVKAWFKLLAIILPIIGGALSEFKSTIFKRKDE